MFQVEELDNQRDIYMDTDWDIRFSHLWGTFSFDDGRRYSYSCKSLRKKNLWNIIFQTLVVQVKCFEEIINIGYAVYRIHGLPWFRSLSWYFLVASNYFFYGESLVDYFGVAISRTVSF